MPELIGDTELKLLAHLHERSAGSGQRIGLDPKSIATRLRVRPDQLAKDASALAGHGLAGLRGFRPSESGDTPARGVSAIWLTGRGEDYLRKVEADPGVRRPITVALVAEMGGVLRAIAGLVLADFSAGTREPP